MLAALYAFAIFVLTIYGVQVGWLAYKRLRFDGAENNPERHTEHWPAVTVQLPVYNEPAVVERLLDACARLEYPRERLEIQLLDDSTDDTSALARRCIRYWREQGVTIHHIRRDSRDGYKAGALQHGLEHASGSLIAIFDADFVPEPGFLRQMVPYFKDDNTGMVQSRWAHLNERDSWLTGAQAVGLDAHFAVEQAGRQAASCFINFNGTGGVWRRECIEDVGGWHADTLTEDLDLSYRAQMQGWELRYVENVEVPAELPPTMDALRTQQARWAQGAIETALKLLPDLWRMPGRLKHKLAGTLHLTGHLAYPALLLVMLTHAPALIFSGIDGGASQAYLAASTIGFLGFAGFALAHVTAQSQLHFGWVRRMAYFPVFLLGTIGIALSNSKAVLKALSGGSSPFFRTPKAGGKAPGRVSGGEIPSILWGEGALAIFGWAGVIALLITHHWVAIPFQIALSAGCTMVVARQLADARRATYFWSETSLQPEKAVG